MNTPNHLTKMIAVVAALLMLGASQASAFIVVGGFPVGITLGQTARLNFANIGEERGVIVNWRFVNADGAVIAQSERPVTVDFHKTVSVDLNRDSLPRDVARIQIRAEIEILTPGNPEKTLMISLEILNNEDGATMVFVPISAY